MSFQDKSSLRIPELGRRLRLGFVGGGRGGLVGEWHFAGARLSNHWHVVAGALSTRADNSAISARDWCIPPERSYHDFRLMAEQESRRPDGIEAVSICTPNASHAEIAETFLRAGIDVILDKPMTTTVEDARKLVSLRNETGLALVMTYPFYHHAMARQAKLMIARGMVGEIRQLHVEYLQDWNVAAQPKEGAAWRQDPAKVGRSSIVGDIGTHAYHLLHKITGLDVAEVRADMFVCGGEKPQPDSAHINMRLTNGAPAVMLLSNAVAGQYCGLRIRIWGDKASLEWDQEKPEILRYVPFDAPEQLFLRGAGGMFPEVGRLTHLPRGHGEALTDAWSNLYAEAALLIGARRRDESLEQDMIDLSGAEDGLRGMLFIEACADSWEKGGRWNALATD